MFLLCLSPPSIKAQSLRDESITDPQEIVQRARAQSVHYSEEFRNLLATETKTFNIYDKGSELKKHRVVVSNFLVYDLSSTKSAITEFRHVLSVDSTPVANASDRAVQLFEKVSKASNTSKELERIQKESLRFDPEIKMYGLTLFQAIALNERIRDVMKFTLSGTARVGNTDAYIVEFEQIRESPYISAGHNSGDPNGVLDYEFDSNGPAGPRIKGTLWVDTKTFQIVREVRTLTVQPKGFTRPAVLTSSEFEFDESKYGIRTPKHIAHTEYRINKDHGSKYIEIIFDYSEFTRPDVEVIPENHRSLLIVPLRYFP